MQIMANYAKNPYDREIFKWKMRKIKKLKIL